MDRIKVFLRKNWLYVIAFLVVFILGFNAFYSKSKIEKLNKTIVEKEYENKLLNEKLKKQKVVSDSLQVKVDSLIVIWETNTKENIIKEIKNKNHETYIRIINASDDEQLSIISKWLSKKSNSR
ncbi:MAG TPA: hypothetical protein PKI46_08490 [Bacteroidales bacterium]|nr:hypothetical protein [Bacteroidales bacterium]